MTGTTLTKERSSAFGPGTAVGPAALLERYRQVRNFSRTLCEPLVTEDYVVQSMPDASPTKWHLAHSTWFFETLVLARADDGYDLFNPKYQYLFNSYYNTLGAQFPRPRRGLLSRPTVEEVWRYREHVDRHMESLLQSASARRLEPLAPVIETGLNHEQQHQELLLTDIKHVFAQNPLCPIYREAVSAPCDVPALRWFAFDEGLYEIGHSGDGFAYDNETPRHRTFVHAFELASRLVSNNEYLDFMRDGGYQRPELWLSDGWAMRQTEGWNAPLYWQQRDGDWWQFTLAGSRPVASHEPVCHVSYFEADAYARWAGAVLPREPAWEVASVGASLQGNFVDSGRYHPAPPAGVADGPLQMFGDVWEWTASPYAAYPGYRPPAGALGEYNAKFMCNQFVLRGGSCATSRAHIRRTYRNFFPPAARWQFSGIRLARQP